MWMFDVMLGARERVFAFHKRVVTLRLVVKPSGASAVYMRWHHESHRADVAVEVTGIMSMDIQSPADAIRAIQHAAVSIDRSGRVRLNGAAVFAMGRPI